MKHLSVTQALQKLLVTTVVGLAVGLGALLIPSSTKHHFLMASSHWLCLALLLWHLVCYTATAVAAVATAPSLAASLGLLTFTQGSAAVLHLLAQLTVAMMLAALSRADIYISDPDSGPRHDATLPTAVEPARPLPTLHDSLANYWYHGQRHSQVGQRPRSATQNEDSNSAAAVGSGGEHSSERAGNGQLSPIRTRVGQAAPISQPPASLVRSVDFDPDFMICFLLAFDICCLHTCLGCCSMLPACICLLLACKDASQEWPTNNHPQNPQTWKTLPLQGECDTAPMATPTAIQYGVEHGADPPIALQDDLTPVAQGTPQLSPSFMSARPTSWPALQLALGRAVYYLGFLALPAVLFWVGLSCQDLLHGAYLALLMLWFLGHSLSLEPHVSQGATGNDQVCQPLPYNYHAL